MDPTARNSDCQFCRVLFQNSGASTYSLQGTGSWKLANAEHARDPRKMGLSYSEVRFSN